jgi:hypothetical protein
MARRDAFACCAALMMSYPLPSDEPRYFHYLGGFDASSFFISMIDLQYLFRQSEFEDRMRRTSPQPPYPDTLACGDPAKLPDVYLVLSESQMDFSILPGLHTVNPANANFMPEGRHLRPLQVETYAGGTWVSSISLMAGLPSADFGVQAPYLTMVLDGKVRGALPEVFARCGYRTVEVTPVKRTFVNEGPFMENIGYQTIFDYDAIGATEYAHEDNFYFNAAEKIVREHHATDKRPLLLYMKTMFTHSPYLHTDVNKHTVAFDGSAELNEYLNRSIAAQNDFLDFLKVVEKQTTVRGSVVLEFGDHHPGVMKELDDAAHGGNSLADLRSLAYRTYYTIHAFDYQLDMTAFPTGPIDIGFLGAALIQAGRLPTPCSTSRNCWPRACWCRAIPAPASRTCCAACSSRARPGCSRCVIDPEGDFVTLADRFGHVVVDAAAHRGRADPHRRPRPPAPRLRACSTSKASTSSSRCAPPPPSSAACSTPTATSGIPVLVVVDEAQLFAPAVAGEVSDEARKLSLGAMTNLMCRGRKRGLAGVIATQRLAKLAKNVAAEASNFLMGRTFLDIDMARAADLLGMDRRQAEMFRDLARGHFVALGPALSRRPLPVVIGAVETSARSTSPKLTPLPEAPEDAAAT